MGAAGSYIKRLFDFLLFSSLFISFCAVMMVVQTNQLLQLQYDHKPYLFFVFFSTMCSYNLHWYYTSADTTEEQRMQWTHRYRHWHLILFIAGAVGSGYYFIYLIDSWFWLGIGAFLTFLYTAPKLPFFFAPWLKKIAIGKTIYLTLVWTYVTTVLPILISQKEWQLADHLLCISRFFFIYCLDIIFDYRDRENDRADGIRSLITYLSEKGIDRLFFASFSIFIISTSLLVTQGFSLLVVIFLLLPGILTAGSYRLSKTNFSDYLYYFALDGLMLLSPLCTTILSI